MKLKSLKFILLVLTLLLGNLGLAKCDSDNKLSSIGPFELYNADSSSSVRLKFVGQLLMSYENIDDGPNSDRVDELYMKVRRIRILLDANLYDPALNFKLQLSCVPKSLELMDFYFNYKYRQDFQFRFGQYKTPFTQYRMQSFQRLSLYDWSFVTKYFGAERQIGFVLHNGYAKLSDWGYILGIFSGVNARASQAIGIPVVYGEDVFNPSDLTGQDQKAEFHPELFIHLNHNAKKVNMRSNCDNERSGIRYGVGLSAAWNLDPTPYQDFRSRLAAELMMKFRGFTLFSVGYTGYAALENQTKTKLAMIGWLGQVSYRVNSKLETFVRYALVDFKDDLALDAYSRGQELITESGNSLEIIDQYEMAGQISREQEITTGFNIIILENKLKWQNDVSLLRHTQIEDDRDDYIVYSQFQIIF